MTYAVYKRLISVYCFVYKNRIYRFSIFNLSIVIVLTIICLIRRFFWIIWHSTVRLIGKTVILSASIFGNNCYLFWGYNVIITRKADYYKIRRPFLYVSNKGCFIVTIVHYLIILIMTYSLEKSNNIFVNKCLHQSRNNCFAYNM